MRIRAGLAALLATVLVIGFAGWARGTDGYPLILGQSNNSTAGTTYTGAPLSVETLAVGNISSPTAGVVVMQTGETVRSFRPQSIPLGQFMVATVQTPNGASVQYARVTPTGRLVIGLNAPAPSLTFIAYWTFDS
jgi:hypothetical protein